MSEHTGERSAAGDGGALVTSEVSWGRATITLDSPHNRNALSRRLVAQLTERLEQADADPEVRVVVLTHTGGTFCAGADLGEASEGAAGDPVRERAEHLADLLRRMLSLETPVVGVVDGHVRAGGMGLVGACDLVIAGPHATFALTEVRLALAASLISLVVLPRLRDRDAARLLLTGETIGARRAAELGLATTATDHPQEALGEVVTALRAAAPQGLRETKALLNHDLLARFDAGRDRVVEQSSRLFASEEAREGMRAFLEKRAPRWAR